MSKKSVDLLIKYELMLSELYTECAKRFPELETFWMGLSDEEIKHADTIKELLEEVDGRNLKLNEKRFNIRPLEISMEHAIEITKRVGNNELDLLATLSLALDIEMSLIESNYYEIFAGNTSEINERLKYIRDEERKHAGQIREMKNSVYNNHGEYS